MKVFVRGYSGLGFAGSFIRKFTFGSYSHVSFIFEDVDGAEEVESIQGNGVVRHPPMPVNGSFDEFVVPLTEEQAIYVHTWAVSFLGAKYDWSGIFGFVRRRNTNRDDKWFCSELVAYCLYKAGYPLSRREPYRETPSTVCESLRILPRPFEVK